MASLLIPAELNPKAATVLLARKVEIENLCRQYDVTRLRIFGSALRMEWNAETSDLDFLAEYGPGRDKLSGFDALVGLQVELSKVLGVPVDIVDWNAAKNPYFRKTAAKSAMDVYAA